MRLHAKRLEIFGAQVLELNVKGWLDHLLLHSPGVWEAAVGVASSLAARCACSTQLNF